MFGFLLRDEKCMLLYIYKHGDRNCILVVVMRVNWRELKINIITYL